MLRTMIAAVLCLCVIAPAPAAEFGTRDEAVAMVKRVQERFKEQGAEATFKAVTAKDKDFNDRDLYPFIYDMRGVNVAHGANAALVGKNLIDLKDQDGKFLIREIVAVAQGTGSGWVNFKWPNPQSKKIEDKASYVEKLGDYAVGVGVYRQ